jgi:hypothetical protein
MGLALLLIMGCGESTGGAGGMEGTGGTAGGSEGTSSRIFVTSTGQNADLGGIAGADELCATQASEAGLQGVFKAWLSTKSSAAADRLAHSNGPYVRVDGTVIAQDWNDLVDGFIDAPINVGAAGQTLSGEVWTGTLVDGNPYSNDDCAGFTSSGTSGFALCGSSGSTATAWTQSSTPNCSTVLRLYCVEQ